MNSNAAQAAKQKGNEAFSAGDFPAAIGHYTSAIIADGTNSIYPLNRAAAYLKLGKYQDAERDCSIAIGLDAKNPKAWYRRAQARQGLDVWDDALDDYKHVLSLEPHNTGVKQDIARVQFLIKNGKKPTRREAADMLKPPPRRRRVPIAIIDSKLPTKKPKTHFDNLMSPVLTRTLVTPEPASSLSPSGITRPSTATARDATSLSRPGGGIFRKSGNHTLVGQDDITTVASSNLNKKDASLNIDVFPQDFAALSIKSVTPTVPTNLYMFDRNWMALKTPQLRWQYLKQITPESLPSVFKTSLDTSVLVSLIHTFNSLLKSGSDPEAVKAYVANFPRVARWDTLVLFLSTSERQMVKEIWDALPVGPDDVHLRKSWGL